MVKVMFWYRGILVIAAMMLSISSSAVTLKIATISPDGSSWMQKMRAGAKEVTAKTQGRVKFKFYPGGVMGSDNAVLRKIRLGQLQGGALTGGSLIKYAPNAQLYNLPLVFRNFEEVDYVRKRMDKVIVNEIEKGGFVTFGLGEGGMAYIMTDSVVSYINDLKQKKIWVPDSDPSSQEAVRAFGLTPVPLSIGDVLPSLQTGMIDTVATSPVAAVALQWHTQVSHITDMPLLYFYAVMAIDKKAFKKIKPADQKIVRNIMNSVFDDIDQQNRKDNIAAFETLKRLGIAVNPMQGDALVGWQQQADSLIKEMIEAGKIDAALFQKMQGYLTESRKQQASR